jgi:hypothetical protein
MIPFDGDGKAVDDDVGDSPDLHASTPRTRQPFTAPSWTALPGGTTFQGPRDQRPRNHAERKPWWRDDGARSALGSADRGPFTITGVAGEGR